MLQQYLPLAVLKLSCIQFNCVFCNDELQQYLPLAVLKPIHQLMQLVDMHVDVATVLTACGIETLLLLPRYLFQNRLLQQYLPLAVLKPLNCSGLKIPTARCNSTYRLRY